MPNEKILSSINNREIREKIYTFRGKQVMVDRDLAELYKVETWFQLTEEEHKILRSQFVT